MAKTIRITIKDGNVEKDFEGFVGTSCTTLENALRPDNFEVLEEAFKNGGTHCESDTETIDN